MVLVILIVACGSEAVKGDGDENIEDACSYETGPSLENVPQEEWPEGMSAAWAAYESIGPSGELSLACDDESEDITFALSSVERVALSQFVFSDLAGPEGCSGHGPASGSMSVSILVEGRLWGLMIGHHRQPHYVAPETRAAATVLADAFAMRVYELESRRLWLAGKVS